MVAASRGNGESAPLLATSNRGGDASASASDSEATPRGARSRNGPGGVVAVCFSVSMIFAGFIVLAIGAYSDSIYSFVNGAFVDGVTAGATYHPSTEQVTLADVSAVPVTMAGGEDYEDLDDLSKSKTPLDSQMEGEGFSKGYREHFHLLDKDHQKYTETATPWKGDTGGPEGGAESD